MSICRKGKRERERGREKERGWRDGSVVIALLEHSIYLSSYLSNLKNKTKHMGSEDVTHTLMLVQQALYKNEPWPQSQQQPFHSYIKHYEEQPQPHHQGFSV